MHFMLLDHELSTMPGRYRTREIFVRDDRRGVNVYRGPDGDLVPELMRALSESLAKPSADDPLVRGAMAHLNLVMIHQFRDGNGRMARALQTMVLGTGPGRRTDLFQHRGVAGQQHAGVLRRPRSDWPRRMAPRK